MARNYTDYTSKSTPKKTPKYQASGADKARAAATAPKAPKPIRVSQATINQIKKLGMTKALNSAAVGTAEYKEGLKRMYGTKRVAAAAKRTTTSGPDVARKKATTPRKKLTGKGY